MTREGKMLDRREFMKGAALAGLGAALVSTATTVAAAQETMRVFWWGTPDRARRTLEIAKLFEADNPDLKLLGEAGTSDYFSKLTTMIAGGNAPDIFALEPGRFAEYSRRGTNLALNDYLGKSIRTDRLVPNIVELGSVDDKMTGVPIALNALALVYSREAFEKAGITPPGANTTWDEFSRLCVDLTKAIGKKNVWAIGSPSKYLFGFQVFVTQRGKKLYGENGKPGFDAKDAADWFAYWRTLAENGGCSSAEFQASDNTMVDSSALTTGNAVMAVCYSNQITAFQSLVKSPLSVTTLPTETAGGHSGLFYRPSQYWSIGKNAKNPEAAAKFIDFFVNDPHAGEILGTERGVPVNLDVRNAILPGLPEQDRLSVEYINLIADRVGPYPPPVPLGVSEFDERAFRPLSDKVAFGQLTPSQAAAELISAGNRMLKK